MKGTALEKRLAAASAIPPSQRSPEVAAFIECCQLQDEIAEEQQQSRPSTPQQEVLNNLKLTRSHVLSVGGSLWYRPLVLKSALDRLLDAASRVPAASDAILSSIKALLELDFSLQTLLQVAAGHPTCITVAGQQQEFTAGFLLLYLKIVKLMQQPAVAARLRQELEQLQAGLPRSLLSYQQLLAHFAETASDQATQLMVIKGGSHVLTTRDADMALADRAAASAAELLPRLLPGDLLWELRSVMASLLHGSLRGGFDQQAADVSQIFSRLRQLFERAQQQGRDYIVALCGYQRAESTGYFADQFARGNPAGLVGENYYAPSAFLSWLQQARQAHVRCCAVLPKQWTSGLKVKQAIAVAHEPLLERLQRDGDCWPTASVVESSQAMVQALSVVAEHSAHQLSAPPILGRGCSSCGLIPTQLLLCSGCRQVRYCSRECQRAHWPYHKSFCKAQQQQREKGCGHE